MKATKQVAKAKAESDLSGRTLYLKGVKECMDAMEICRREL